MFLGLMQTMLYMKMQPILVYTALMEDNIDIVYSGYSYRAKMVINMVEIHS